MRFRKIAIGLLLGVIIGYSYQTELSTSNLKYPPSDSKKGENHHALSSKVETKPQERVEPKLAANVSPSDVDITTTETLLDYLTKKKRENSKYSYFGDRELRALLANSPELISELFSELTKIDSPTLRDEAVQLISIHSLFLRNETIPKILLSKLQSGEDFEKWLRIGSLVNASSEPLNEYLIGLLPSFAKPSNIRETIELLSRNSYESIDIMDPFVRSSTISTIGAFRDHQNSEVRASVVASYNNFPPENIEIQLLAAMQDPSSIVRSTAMQVTSQSLKTSTALKDYMLSKLGDSSTHVLERQSTAFTLQSMPLETSEFEETINTISEIDAYMQSLTDAEKDSIIESFYQDVK